MSKSQRAGVLLVALLAGISVRADEIYYRRPFEQWPWIDWLVGLLLAISAALALSGGRRLIGSRATFAELARRSGGIADAAWVLSRGGHTSSVLERIAEQACETVGAQQATIAIRDSKDPRTAVVIADHGHKQSALGRRFGVDEGLIGRVFVSGEPVVAANSNEMVESAGREGSGTARAAAAAPIRWGGEVCGVLWLGTRWQRDFVEHDLEWLRRLADLAAVALEQAEMRQRLELAVGSGVETLAEAIDMRDNYTWQHSQNVKELAVRVAERLGLGQEPRVEVAIAARLHDVGKIGVPDSVLLKAGPLNEDEWEIMKQYPLRGAEMLERVPGLKNVAQIVLCEHEHWDGSGYPKGLKSEDIPLASRIILACDAYDAMVSARPWRSALKPWAAVRELRAGAGREFDPQVVVQLISVLRESSASITGSALWAPRPRQKA